MYHECITCTACGLIYFICCYYKYMYHCIIIVVSVVAIVQCIHVDCIGRFTRERGGEREGGFCM